jgi:hypothetical protein
VSRAYRGINALNRAATSMENQSSPSIGSGSSKTVAPSEIALRSLLRFIAADGLPVLG